MKSVNEWLRAQSKATLIAISVILALNLALLGLSVFYCARLSKTVKSLRANRPDNFEESAATVASTTKEIELNPDNEVAYHRRARLYMRDENYEKALHDLSRVLELKPDNMDAYIDRAFLYDQLKDPEKAKLDREKVRELNRSGR